MSATKFLPYPYFRVDKSLMVLSTSQLAKEIFTSTEDFLSLVDEESKEKAIKILSGKKKRAETELVLETNASPFTLFTVSIQWEDKVGHIICIEKDSQVAELTELVQKHRQRLSETNFELLEKKEDYQNALMKITELSSPFIPLTNKLVLIPLFGKVNEDFVMVNRERLLQKGYQDDYETYIIDFSGVGELTEDGVSACKGLIKQFSLLGLECVITGLKPSHVFYLGNSESELNLKYESSLSKVISQLT